MAPFIESIYNVLCDNQNFIKSIIYKEIGYNIFINVDVL